MKKILLFALLLICLFSCTKKHMYLQLTSGEKATDTTYLTKFSEYKLQVGDIVYVDVVTPNSAYTQLFKQGNDMSQGGNFSNTSAYIQGLSIQQDGTIELPLVGKIPAIDHTVDELKDIIKQEISEIVVENTVRVRLLAFKVNIIGEVSRPGEFMIYRDKATIFEALSLAGDVNYYAKRREIMVYRQEGDARVPYKIDLTKRSAFESPVYYLQPHDLIYVQPLARTIFRVNVSDFVSYLAPISSSLALIVAILSLTSKRK